MCYAGWHQGGALQRHLEAHRGGGRCPLHGETGSNSDILHGWDSVGRAVQAAVKGNESVAEPVEQLGYWVLGETDGDSDFIYDIENDFVEVEGGRVFSLNKITPKNK